MQTRGPVGALVAAHPWCMRSQRAVFYICAAVWRAGAAAGMVAAAPASAGAAGPAAAAPVCALAISGDSPCAARARHPPQLEHPSPAPCLQVSVGAATGTSALPWQAAMSEVGGGAPSAATTAAFATFQLAAQRCVHAPQRGCRAGAATRGSGVHAWGPLPAGAHRAHSLDQLFCASPPLPDPTRPLTPPPATHLPPPRDRSRSART